MHTYHVVLRCSEPFILREEKPIVRNPGIQYVLANFFQVVINIHEEDVDRLCVEGMLRRVEIAERVLVPHYLPCARGRTYT